MNKNIDEYPKSRKEAIEKGEKYYFTGKPCKYGHISVRERSGCCYQCELEYQRRFRAENREKLREYARACREKDPHYNSRYYFKNKDYCRERLREWRANNPGYMEEYNRKYRENNRAGHRERQAHRRAVKITATPKWIDRDEVKYIYDLASEKGLVVDHIVPLQSEYVCGLHCADNLRCIPEDLNRHKKNRYWPDMPVFYDRSTGSYLEPEQEF